MKAGPALKPPVQVTRFGALLRSYRLARDVSQNKLAHAIGVDPAHVNRVERFGKPMSRPLVMLMADTLGLDPDDRDRLLFAAGHAPVRDFQSILDSALNRLSAMRQTVTGVAS